MLSDFIKPESIIVDLESEEKEECFAELLEVLVAQNPGLNRRSALEALITREDKKSTAVFPYVAVPHAVSDSITKTVVAIGVSRSGIEFEPVNSEDNSKSPIVNVVFEILFDKKDTEGHLHALRDILQLVVHPEFVKSVLKAKSQKEIYDLIVSLEA